MKRRLKNHDKLHLKNYRESLGIETKHGRGEGKKKNKWLETNDGQVVFARV